MRLRRQDPGFERLATLDVETTHYEPSAGELVSIGVGVHEVGDPGDAATYDTFHRDGDGEAALVRRTVDRLAAYDADGLVTYNGTAFDLDFVRGRLARLDASVALPEVATSSQRHVDLFRERKRRADREGVKWPSLEECLASYGLPQPVTRWNGAAITNRRFGEDIGPAYLRALGDGSPDAAELVDAIDHYLATDLEANVALFHADVGEAFDPHLLGTESAFGADGTA